MTGNAMVGVLGGIVLYVLLAVASARYVRRLAKAEYERGWNDAVQQDQLDRGPLLWDEPLGGRRIFDRPLYDQDADPGEG